MFIFGPERNSLIAAPTLATCQRTVYISCVIVTPRLS